MVKMGRDKNGQETPPIQDVWDGIEFMFHFVPHHSISFRFILLYITPIQT
jgi:hypothetical protein